MSKSSNQTVIELLSLTPHIQQFQDGRVIYVIAEKQSNTGIFNNSRLLVFNGKQKTIGYSNTLPKNIQFDTIDDVNKDIKKKAMISQIQINKKQPKTKKLQIRCKGFNYKKKNSDKEDVWTFIFKSQEAANETQRLFNLSICESLGKPLPQGMSPPIRDSLDSNRSPFEAAPHSSSPPKQVKQIKSLNNEPQTLINLSLQKYRNSSLPSIKQQEIPQKQAKNQINNYFVQQQKQTPLQNLQIQRKSNFLDIIVQKQPPMDGFRYTHNNKQKSEKQNINYSSIKPSFEEPLIDPLYSQALSRQIDNSNIQQIKNNNQTLPLQSKVSESILPSYKPSSKKFAINPNISLPQGTIREKQKQRLLTDSRSVSYFPLDDNQNETNLRLSKYNSRKYISGIQVSEQQRINNIHNINYLPQNNSINRGQSFQQNSYISQKSILSNSRQQIHQKFPDWNKQLYLAKDPYDVVNKFGETSSLLVKGIIDSLTNDNEKYKPISIGESSTIYEEKNMIIVMAFSRYSEGQVVEMEESLIKEHQTYKYLGTFMRQNDKIRFPLTNLIRYKGIVSLIRAIIGSSVQQNKETMRQQLKRLEMATKISRQQFVNRCNFKQIMYGGQNVVFLDDIYSLLPKDASVEFNPQLLRHYMRQDGQFHVPEVQQLVKFRNSQQNQLIRELDSLQNMILSSNDLAYQLKRYGLTKDCVNHLHRKTRHPFLKSIFASQMVAQMASGLLLSYIKTQLRVVSKKKNINPDKVLLKLCSEFIDDLCSLTQNSEQLWKLILRDVKDTYTLKITSSQIKWGYFFGAFLKKSGLKYNLRLLDKEKRFCSEPNCLNSHFVQNFICRYQTTDLSSYQKIYSIQDILNKESSQTEFRNLKSILEKNISVSQYIQNNSLFDRTIAYLANFISPSNSSSSMLINPYDYPSEPASLTYMRLQLIKLKWLLKHKDEQYSISILQQSCELISFWGGQFHPLLSQFYDLFSAYYIMTDQKDEALTLAKSSLVNIIKLVGTGAISTGQKYYQLGNILFAIERREDALTHYVKARDVLVNNGLVNSTQFGLIELKIGTLYLHFGKLSEAQSSSLHALNAFQQQRGQKLMQCFQLLVRIYQLQPNYQKLRQYASLCSIKFNHIQNQQLFSRMVRVSIYPFIIELPKSKKLILLEFCQTIQISIQNDISKKPYYNWLFRKALKQNITEAFINALGKIDLLALDSKKSQAFKTYKGISNNRSESRFEEFLNLLESILAVTDPAFIIGVLRDFQY